MVEVWEAPWCVKRGQFTNIVVMKEVIFLGVQVIPGDLLRNYLVSGSVKEFAC
jgi:hypothetical protein